ncbi:MAG: response regulator transcription factor, partial [Gluconacetobacter diazotrophicus]|nr:response regulator transcription factor [Gluconacetobacter diazotrophicus]
MPDRERRAADAGGEATRVLLVEDSDTQALQIRRRLEREGFAVARAASAEAALDALNAALPDIVVLDYHLPGMSGAELLRTLRSNNRTRVLPVLMLTEAAGPDTEREGLESGADAYAPKSADMAVIAARLRAMSRHRGGPDEAAEPSGGAAGAVETRPGRVRRARIALAGAATARLQALDAALRRDGHEVRLVADGAASPGEPGHGADAGAPAPDCVVVEVADGDDGGFDRCR